MSDDFMCICDDEEEAKSNAVYQWALKELQCKPETFLTNIIHGMWWEFNAYLTGIATDMWCGVSVGRSAQNPETGKYEEAGGYYVECDMVEHGLARIYQIMKEEEALNAQHANN